MSHGNKLPSRVEVRHRTDAVFYVSVFYVRSALFQGIARACFRPTITGEFSSLIRPIL